MAITVREVRSKNSIFKGNMVSLVSLEGTKKFGRADTSDVKKNHMKDICFWYLKSVFIGHAAEFANTPYELRMCSISSWIPYKPVLLQNKLVKHLTDDF